MDQIFGMRMIIHKIWQNLLHLHIDLGKEYLTNDWEATQDVLCVFGGYGRLLQDMTAFYKGALGYIMMNGGMSKSFRKNEGVRHRCAMLAWLFTLFKDGEV